MASWAGLGRLADPWPTARSEPAIAEMPATSGFQKNWADWPTKICILARARDVDRRGDHDHAPKSHEVRNWSRPNRVIDR